LARKIRVVAVVQPQRRAHLAQLEALVAQARVADPAVEAAAAAQHLGVGFPQRPQPAAGPELPVTDLAPVLGDDFLVEAQGHLVALPAPPGCQEVVAAGA